VDVSFSVFELMSANLEEFLSPDVCGGYFFEVVTSPDFTVGQDLTFDLFQ